MSEDHARQANGEWEPMFDVPDNLHRDGSNYVKWIWSLLDDGIEIPMSGSFIDLRTQQGKPLLDPDMAAHLDDQMKVARRAAAANNHGLEDVVTCRRAGDIDAGPLVDELSRLFFTDSAAALSRAGAIGEICDVAEEFCREAIHLKRTLATDRALPRTLRQAIDKDAADEQEGGRV